MLLQLLPSHLRAAPPRPPRRGRGCGRSDAQRAEAEAEDDAARGEADDSMRRQRGPVRGRRRVVGRRRRGGGVAFGEVAASREPRRHELAHVRVRRRQSERGRKKEKM